jgi:predicted transcriptional regulator of viral defense system
MASINIMIHEHEKQAVLKVLRKKQGITISVSKIGELAKINPNRTRFIIEDLIEEGRLKRIPTKKFNDKYIRYSYEVLQ